MWCYGVNVILNKTIFRKVYSLIARCEALARDLLFPITKKPIIILGNQKSGTSVIAALLGKISRKSVTIDLINDVKNPKFHLVKQGHLAFDEFVNLNKADFSRQIIKEPNLTLFYDEMSSYFPGAKFVFVIRDPRDNIRSILNRLDLPGGHVGPNVNMLDSVPDAWKYVLEANWMGIEGDNFVESLANRWNYMADVYLNNKDDMALIKYEDFNKSKVF